MLKNYRKLTSIIIMTAFIGTSLNMPQAHAGEVVMLLMPKPGTMVNLSPAFVPAHLQGIVIHPDNALQFDFLIHKGDGNLDQVQKKEEYNKLIKYFLASLTVPDADQWVNLSPYEHNRIIKDNFGKTEMGRDLLGQDYLLKQITSSLMYPESGLGKDFWNKVYEKAYKELGNTNIPVNTFNKVWIVPSEAVIHENGNTAFIVQSHLKVMLEEDYVSLEKHIATNIPQNNTHALSSKVIKDIILPALEQEVNEGKNFAQLRQVFSGMILATWYKQALKESLLGKVYADKAKTKGIDQDPKANEAIYQKYIAAFKKGVYNYIKEDADKYTNQVIPRKYFAGGVGAHGADLVNRRKVTSKVIGGDFANIGEGKIEAVKADLDAAMSTLMTSEDLDSFFHQIKNPVLLNVGQEIQMHADLTISRDATKLYFVSPATGKGKGSRTERDLPKYARVAIFGKYISIYDAHNDTFEIFEPTDGASLQATGREISARYIDKDLGRAIVDGLYNMPFEQNSFSNLLTSPMVGRMDRRSVEYAVIADLVESIRSAGLYITTAVVAGKLAEEHIRIGNMESHLKEESRIVPLANSLAEFILGDYFSFLPDSIEPWNIGSQTFIRNSPNNARKLMDDLDFFADNITDEDSEWVYEVLIEPKDVPILADHFNEVALLEAPLVSIKYFVEHFASRFADPNNLILDVKADLEADNIDLGIVNPDKRTEPILGMFFQLWRLAKILGNDSVKKVIESVFSSLADIRNPNSQKSISRFKMLISNYELSSFLPEFKSSAKKAEQPPDSSAAMTAKQLVAAMGVLAMVSGGPNAIAQVQPNDPSVVKQGDLKEYNDIFKQLAAMRALAASDKLFEMQNGFDDFMIGYNKNRIAIEAKYPQVKREIGTQVMIITLKKNQFAADAEGVIALFNADLDAIRLNALAGEYDRLSKMMRSTPKQQALAIAKAKVLLAKYGQYMIGDKGLRLKQYLQEMSIPPKSGLTVKNSFQPVDGNNVSDAAMRGGIDMNATNMELVIKRDGKGVPLPMAQQDMAQLSRIEGFVPHIIEIRPAMMMPQFSHLFEN